ncbi:ricin-type beta-trefoil lectin domain protein [Nocardia sp. CNY236]|uniref:RICIN domain-containing protein n=1 Tax=Nocardia sp. CNY236 TaxID=1169152 RepID=UPI00041D4AB1|nr:ricin-type beta-trefoil lectin domain protein [Nocardia sp. CNY236]
MSHVFKRVLQTASIAFTTSVFMAGLSAPNAFAAENENTWMKNLWSGECATALDNGSVFSRGCKSGNLAQLWDRRDDRTIRRAFSEQCLDSNSDGHVYWLQCNGGNYQKWLYEGTKVKNVATGRYLWYDVEWGRLWASPDPSHHTSDWEFSGSV